MPTRANALAVMAKAPVPGSVKTRMVPPLTPEQAAALYRAILLDQLEHLTRLTASDLYVAFTPDDAAALMKSLVPAAFACFPQRGDDLGERMHEVLAELWRRGHRNLVLIGSDVPAVPLDFFHDTFNALEGKDEPDVQVVFGPSEDGGYYLVGMNQPTPEIFDGMTWSHDRVLAQTTEKLTRLGIAVKLLPSWFDIDTIEDLKRLQTISDPAVRNAMQGTLDYLRHLGLDQGPRAAR
jgi:rSAM/selenodomain-associated transferase 1